MLQAVRITCMAVVVHTCNMSCVNGTEYSANVLQFMHVAIMQHACIAKL